MKKAIVTILFLIAINITYSQESILYKKVKDVNLHMEVFHPNKSKKGEQHPAIVFFFGGGWKKGTLKQFEPHAKYFAQRGAVCFLVDYRVKSRQKTTPFESLKDAKSAIRFIRKNAKKFNIDPNQIIASGGSAGGHLAAAAALIEKYNQNTDDLSISPKPNALVLFNPALDNGPAGVGYERVKNDYLNFSPLHNIKKDTPPTLILTGTNDNLIPVDMIKTYQQKMKKVGSRCDVVFYEGKNHGFFNYRKFENYKKTIAKMDAFLVSLTHLKSTPKIIIE
ncbi:alpha/beta hydrolase [Polaribacter sp.]|uniref:alpha/beta hydrolase n=1 Tax=Polaribacter sp. TaxID=1920175 RepID=UPI003F6BE8FC